MEPLHSATTDPSALDPVQMDFDPRLAAPFHLKIRKPLTVCTNKNLRILPGHRRESYRGNPVFVGFIRLPDLEACQRHFCVTGDTDDGDYVTLTIQDQDDLGLPISENEEILQKAMKKAQELTQAGIMEILEVHPPMWMNMYTPTKELEGANERLGRDPSRVRDYWPDLFKYTIMVYVVRTIEAARDQERKHFTTMMQEPDGLTEIYRQCGWTDLAERTTQRWHDSS